MEFFLSDGSAPTGPFGAEALREMSLGADTYVRPGPEGAWARAGEVPELAAALAGAGQRRAEGFAALGGQDPVSAAGAMTWGPPKADHCTAPGYRQYSAILWNIPHGQDWEAACWSHPNTINGHYFAKPARCKHSGLNMWGEWDVPDASCAKDTNAVVFLVPEFPAQLGHVGWGFKNADGSWTYGATENNGMPVVPGFDNGMFIDTGSKAEMLRTFRDGIRRDGTGSWKYYSCKVLNAAFPRPEAGMVAAQMAKSSGYIVIGNNCMDHSVRVLNAYAQVPIVPVPPGTVSPIWSPRIWFTFINGPEKLMSEGF